MNVRFYEPVSVYGHSLVDLLDVSGHPLRSGFYSKETRQSSCCVLCGMYVIWLYFIFSSLRLSVGSIKW